ncbi:MAG TPA: hypothetical protein ACFE0H_05690, partial [Elainellaceae cyanobacterium]
MLQTVWKWLSRVLGVDREGDRPIQPNRLLPNTTQQTSVEHRDGVHLTHADSSNGDREHASHLSESTESRLPTHSSAHQSGSQHDGQTKLTAQFNADERATDMALGAVGLESVQTGSPSVWAASVTPELLKRCGAQESRIESLKQQLKELRPTAAIGEAWLRKGQAYGAPFSAASEQTNQFHLTQPALASNREEPLTLQQQIVLHDEIITGLEQEVQEARRLST